MDQAQIEHDLERIQRSTKTLLPFFVPWHNSLRMRYKWYYRWHLWEKSSLAHILVLLGFVAGSFYFIYNNGFVPHSTATASSITLTSQADWEAGTTDNIDTTDSPGSMKIDTLSSQIVVSDAGDSSYDGIYTENGSYNGYPAYTNGSRWLYYGYMVGDWMLDTGWRLSVDLTEGFNTPYYGGENIGGVWSTIPTPPVSPDAIAPAPTVSIGASAIHLSAPTQLDGGDTLENWTSFEPSATIPASTSVDFRFRTSDDASSWGSWTSSTSYAASIDLTSLLSETDIVKRYLQVETTLANTDGVSTPVLADYTANYNTPFCPVGTTETAGSGTIDTQADWEAGTLENIDTTSSPGNISIVDSANHIDLPALYASSPELFTVNGNEAAIGNVVDENDDTSWDTPYDETGGTYWWNVDLQSNRHIEQVRILQDTASTFVVSYSTDGISYSGGSPVECMGTYKTSWCIINPDVVARYVRASFTSSIGGAYPAASLWGLELYQTVSGTHTSAPTQLDGTANIATWTNFTPSGTIPANTSINFRFRTSDDASSWGSWTASTAYAATIDLTSLLSEADLAKRYLQVETTLANTDGVSTPILGSYTAEFISCVPDEPAPTCNDGIQNGDETGVDCGGSCDACPVEPTCNDGIQNGDETGVDCGGSCDACPVPESCSDGILNQNETGIDCGGVCDACPVEPTCNDGIQNGDETGVDCGGSCDACEVCEINECTAEASNAYNECRSETGSNYLSCYGDYCEAVHQCATACGFDDGVEVKTVVVAPNGEERYQLGTEVPIKWIFRNQSMVNVANQNFAMLMSVSTDGGENYHAAKILIPGSGAATSYQSVLNSHPGTTIGIYQLIGSVDNSGQVSEGSYLQYNWTTSDLSYISTGLRIKLEPQIISCAIAIDGDSSDNNFEIFGAADARQIYVSIVPSYMEALPDDEIIFEAKSELADGEDVTKETEFTFLSSDKAEIKNSNGNLVTLVAGEDTGYFERILTAAGTYQGLTANGYADMKINKEEVYTPSPKDPEPDPCNNVWCQIMDLVRNINGAGSTASAALAALLALIIGLGNASYSSLSTFRDLIAPLLKGKNKKKQESMVYDVLTSLPVRGAKILLVDQELKTTSSIMTSGMDGKYSLELSPGKTYNVRVEKSGYIQHLKNKDGIWDGELPYTESYLGENFKANNDQYLFRKNIPMIENDTESLSKRLVRRANISLLLIGLNTILILGGSIVAIIIFYYYPTTINFIVILLYILILTQYLINRLLVYGRSYGKAVDKISGKELDLVIVRAVDSANRLVKTAVTDTKGRFILNLPKGKYMIYANKNGWKLEKSLKIEVTSSFTPRHDNIEMIPNDPDKDATIKASSQSIVDANDILEHYSRNHQA